MKFRLFALALALVAPQSAHAYSSGISSNALGPTGCNVCHTGGTAPTVSVTGPTTVTGGTSNEYLVTISSPAGQLSAGLNAHIDIGTLAAGGSESTLTKIIASGSGNNDITQSGTKAGDGSQVLFSFLFEAPESAGTATLEVWGNAVNGNGMTSGDASSLDSLTITVEAAPPPPPPSVPVSSPWSQAGLILLLLAAGSLLVLRRREQV